jgi:hypothetical protein
MFFVVVVVVVSIDDRELCAEYGALRVLFVKKS